MLSCCHLCGGRLAKSLRLADGEAPWLGQVRAIYIQNCNWFQPTLSGVADWLPNTHPLLLPREHELQHPDNEQQYDRSKPYGAKVRIDQSYPPVNPYINREYWNTGFLFHDNCWKLLEWSCYPNEVNIRTLNLFMRSFGITPREHVINWGHTYGHVYHGASDHEQFRDIFSYNTSFMNRRDGLDRRQFYDPLVNEPFIDKLTARINEKEENLAGNRSCCLSSERRLWQESARKGTEDSFGELPVEILEFILIHLSSKDVRSARLASRTLADVPLGQTFWRSRFSPGNEFDFFPEPWLLKDKAINQPIYSNSQAVYDAIRSEIKSGSLHFENRIRIWRVLQPLSDALRAFAFHEKESGKVEPAGEAISSLWEHDLDEEDSRRWECTHGELLNSFTLPYHFGCRPLFKRTVSFSGRCEVIKVSVLPWHGVTYITGIRILLENGMSVVLGYSLADREVSVPIGGRLRGFEVATGDRGIHALAPIASDKSSFWVGDKAKYKIRRLAPRGGVGAVKAYLDGMKMVYLGVPDYIHDPQGPFSIWQGARDDI